MADLNIFAIQGRLTADAEFSTFGHSDTPKVKFSLANNIGYGDYKHANFFNCEFIGKGAAAVAQYLTKGKPVNITGEVKQERWETQEGKRSTIKLIVRNLNLLSEGHPQGQTQNQPQQNAQQGYVQPPQQSNPFAQQLNNNAPHRQQRNPQNMQNYQPNNNFPKVDPNSDIPF